ncbi:hypothetical protein EMCRGX_G014851 [Ephydatia muelleri]
MNHDADVPVPSTVADGPLTMARDADVPSTMADMPLTTTHDADVPVPSTMADGSLTMAHNADVPSTMVDMALTMAHDADVPPTANVADVPVSQTMAHVPSTMVHDAASDASGVLPTTAAAMVPYTARCGIVEIDDSLLARTRNSSSAVPQPTLSTFANSAYCPNVASIDNGNLFVQGNLQEETRELG